MGNLFTAPERAALDLIPTKVDNTRQNLQTGYVYAAEINQVIDLLQATDDRAISMQSLPAALGAMALPVQIGKFHVETDGYVWIESGIRDRYETAYSIGGGFYDAPASGQFRWHDNENVLGSVDAGIGRAAPGVVKVTDGASGLAQMRMKSLSVDLIDATTSTPTAVEIRHTTTLNTEDSPIGVALDFSYTSPDQGTVSLARIQADMGDVENGIYPHFSMGILSKDYGEDPPAVNSFDNLLRLGPGEIDIGAPFGVPGGSVYVGIRARQYGGVTLESGADGNFYINFGTNGLYFQTLTNGVTSWAIEDNGTTGSLYPGGYGEGRDLGNAGNQVRDLYLSGAVKGGLAKYLTEGVATNFARCPCPANQWFTGRLLYRLWFQGSGYPSTYAYEMGEVLVTAMADADGIITFSLVPGTPASLPPGDITTTIDAVADGSTGYFFLRCNTSSTSSATPQISFRFDYCDAGHDVTLAP